MRGGCYMSIKIKMLAVLTAIASMSGLVFATQSQAVYVDSTPDCDKFAIIRCGTKDLTQLRVEYDSLNKSGSNSSTTEQRDIPAIFSAMGISRADLESTNGQFTFGDVYTDGRVVVNGKTVATGARVAGRHMGGTPISGSSTAGIIPASKMATAQRAIVKFNYDGQFLFAVMTPCGNPVTATNTVPKPKPPVYACEQISKKEISRTEYDFGARSSYKDGAVASGFTFNFGDGTSKTVGPQSGLTRHAYAKPGTYTVTVTALFTANGKNVSATAPACKTTVTVKAEELKPVYACEQISKKEISRTEYEFGAKSSVKNGATATGFSYDFGDGQKKTTGLSDSTQRHTYAKPGTYNVSVTALFKVNGKSEAATAPACKTTVTVKPEVVDVKPVYSCDALTASQISRAKYSFNSRITAEDGASVKSRTFEYGDGTTETKDATGPVEHTYAKAGTYTVKLTANILVNGTTVPATSAACTTKVTVKEADKPGVSIIKTVNGVEHEAVAVNEVFNYEVKVTNTGNVDLKDAVVTDNAPKGVTFKSADKGEIKDNKWSYTIPTLKVGESMKFNIKAVVAEYLPGTIVNNACVETPTVPGEKPCDDATVEVPEPKVERCDTTTNEIVKDIPLSQANDEKYTTDYSQCEETPEVPVTPVTPETPVELPKTGLSQSITAVIGLGSLTMATYYYVASRRS